MRKPNHSFALHLTGIARHGEKLFADMDAGAVVSEQEACERNSLLASAIMPRCLQISTNAIPSTEIAVKVILGAMLGAVVAFW